MTPLHFILGLLCISPSVFGAIIDEAGQQQAFDYLNELRVRADMTAFTAEPLLNQAAQNHAVYLIDNKAVGHIEQVGQAGFTGETPSDRAKFVDFPNLSVGENVAVGQKTVAIAVDGLMGSIYHRFGFLSFDYDSIGIGIARELLSTEVSGAYSFTMANQGITNLCQQPETDKEFGRFILQACHPDIKLEEGDYTNALINVQGHNPLIVQWPPKNASDIPPAFFEESPDPLPDRSVSGYPVSVQFNPLSFEAITLKSFRLFHANGAEITHTRLLTQTTDPNQKFSGLEFALFPLDRLDWHQQYRAEFIYHSGDEVEQTLDWTFTTRDLNMTVFTADANGETIKIPSNQAAQFALYVPPRDELSRIGQVQWSGSRTQVAFIDGNTLKINLPTEINSQSNFSLSGGRSFSLQVVDSVEAAPNSAPQARFSLMPEQGEAPLIIKLDGRASFDAEDSIEDYQWTAQLRDDDDAPVLTASGQQAQLTLEQAGHYVVRLTVTDAQGLRNQDSQTILVETPVTDAATVVLPTLTFPDLKSVYREGDKLSVKIEEQAANRDELVDLWVAVLLPSQTLIFLTPNGLAVEPQAIKTNIAFDQHQHLLLDYHITAGLAGDYTLYGLYIAAGKNPFKDSFLSHRSNLLIKHFTIE